MVTNSIYATEMEMRRISSTPTIIDDSMTNELYMEVMNRGDSSVENPVLVALMAVPSGLTVAQIDVMQNPESEFGYTRTAPLDYKTEMVKDSTVRITVNLPRINPKQAETIYIKMYYGGDLVAPEYNLENYASLYVDELLRDSKGFISKVVDRPDVPINS